VHAVLRRWSLALALSALLESGQPGERAEADAGQASAALPTRVRLVGEHEVRASSLEAGLELVLKRGFAVKLPRKLAATVPVVLRIAKMRSSAHAIAADFVPIGPTVELSAALSGVEVSFAADHFRVRSGHRLVLALEQAETCVGAAACWQSVPAAYEKGRCIARDVRTYGRRLQFGSLPASEL
jgi:hypothetical protein